MKIDEIYLGDAYELIKQVPDKSVDLIVTDPPYQFVIGGSGGAFGKKKRDYHAYYEEVAKKYQSRKTEGKATEAERINKNKQKNKTEYGNFGTGIDESILDECCRVLKKINIYIWCNKEQIFQYMKYFIEGKKCLFDIITWHKANPIPTCNNSYLPDTEYCLFFREKGVKLEGNYETKKKFYITTANKEDKDDYDHPTIKPLDIIRNLIINSSGGGSVILDPFIGSGTTAVAAKELGRHFLGFEINEKFHTIAVNRVNGITQKEAKTGWVQEKLF